MCISGELSQKMNDNTTTLLSRNQARFFQVISIDVPHRKIRCSLDYRTDMQDVIRCSLYLRIKN